MGRPSSVRHSQAGFTIVETLIACVVLLSGLLAVASLIDVSNKTTTVTRARVNATNIAREVVEAGRGISYDKISDATVLSEIQASDAGLADAQPGNPYTIERRNVVFTITADTCILDDGRDGGGDAPRAGDYCSDSVAVGALDPRNNRTDRIPEDYKRIRAEVSWTFRGQTRRVMQTTFVNNPGSAGAPAILTLTSSTLGNPPRQIGPGETSANFAVTTSSVPANVIWMLDGAKAGLVCTGCSGRGPFGFTWQLDGGATPAEDGPYLISAEAYDKANVSGPTRSVTVIVNRSRPLAPRGVAGGFQPNGFVDLEWLANSERDLTGYTVNRLNSAGSEVPVCSLSLATTCTDKVPPSTDTIDYIVRPWDIDADGQPRVSAEFTQLRVGRTNQPPAAPVNVRRATADDGSVSIVWGRPDPADPDEGDSIAFYRIYRDGLSFADRYARADDDGTVGSWQDSVYNEGHRYWVVAVDTHLRESDPVEATP